MERREKLPSSCLRDPPVQICRQEFQQDQWVLGPTAGTMEPPRWPATTVGSGPGPLAQDAVAAAWQPWPHTQTPGGSRSQNVTGNKLSRLDGCAAAACGSQRIVFLNGRRNSGHSLELVWQRIVGFFSGCSAGDGLRGRSMPFPRLCSF